jgi:EF hand
VLALRRIHDTNGNGTVDLSEFQKLHGFLTSMQARMVVCQPLLLRTGEQQHFKCVFRIHNKANTAQLTPFLLLAQSSFHQFDRDRSGALDRGEVHHALTAAGGLMV